MSLFCTPNVVVQTATTSATILGTTDLAQFTITAASNATLPTTSGQYAGYVMSNRTGGQGLCYIENVATSTANVTLVAASGDTNFGTTNRGRDAELGHCRQWVLGLLHSHRRSIPE
jgi:hypothetical protein